MNALGTEKLAILVAHTYNPSTLWEAEAGRSSGQEFETNLTNMVKPCLY